VWGPEVVYARCRSCFGMVCGVWVLQLVYARWGCQLEFKKQLKKKTHL
jgi:hypothetical protein